MHIRSGNKEIHLTRKLFSKYIAVKEKVAMGNQILDQPTPVEFSRLLCMNIMNQFEQEKNKEKKHPIEKALTMEVFVAKMATMMTIVNINHERNYSIIIFDA